MMRLHGGMRLKDIRALTKIPGGATAAVQSEQRVSARARSGIQPFRALPLNRFQAMTTSRRWVAE
jgi:hypothetical protein